jgi:shikimate kinase
VGKKVQRIARACSDRGGAVGEGIALIGFMGSGKTTVGRALAARLGWPFVDLDAELAAAFGPIADQIARDGEPAFRARERARALALCDGQRRVLATGGGTWLDASVRLAIGGAYRTAWLDVPLDVVAGRVGDGEGRPLWDDRVGVRYEERRPLYAEAALRVDGDAPVDAIVDRILAASW